MKNNKHYLPNKITIFILGLLILGSLAYGIYYIKNKKTVANTEKPKNIAFTLVKDKKKDDRFLDSDNDGAYDWIEDLWPELDPHNPDSDGDGVLDGEYIKQKQRIYEKNRNKNLDIQTNLTQSEKLGRSVYTALLAVNNPNDATQEQISKNIETYVSGLYLGDTLYTRDEIKTVDNSRENSYAYRDAMLKIFKKYPIRTSEIDLMLKAIKNPKEHEKEIENAAIKYNNYIKDLFKMKVPSLIAGRHTQFLNALGQLEGSLKNLGSKNIDDIVTFSSLVQIKKTLETIIETNTKINTYFDIISDPSIFDEIS